MRRLLGVAVTLVVLVVLYLSVFGFPSWLAEDLLRRLSTGSLSVDAGHVKLHPLRGLALHDVRVYSKRTIGPPAVEADRITVSVDLIGPLAGRQFLRDSTISDGVLRPEMFRRSARGQGEARQRLSLPILVRNCLVYDVTVVDLAATVEAGPSGIRVDGIAAALARGAWEGRLSGDVAFDASNRTLSGRLETNLDPHLLKPLFAARRLSALTVLTDRLAFGASVPRWNADFNYRFGEGSGLELDGGFWMGDCSYRGVDMLRADGRLRVELAADKSLIRVDPLLVVRPEGILNGGFELIPRQKSVTFHAVSSLHPPAMGRMLNLMTNTLEETLSFAGPVTVVCRGEARYGGLEGTDFTAEVDGRGMGWRRLRSEDCSLQVRMIDRSVTLSNIRGHIHGGEFAGDAQFDLRGPSRPESAYALNIDASRVEFGALMTALGGADRDYEGLLSGRTSIRGLLGAGNAGSATGEGSVRVGDGRIYQLPLFGGFSDLMSRTVPGVEFVMRQTDARTDFTIADGKAHAGKVLIEGDVFSVRGEGDYHFDRGLDFTVQLSFLKEKTLGGKIVRIPTFLFSRLLEMRLTGTLDDPKWSMFESPRSLLRKLGSSGPERPEEDRGDED